MVNLEKENVVRTHLIRYMEGFYDHTPSVPVKLWSNEQGDMALYRYPEKGTLVLGILTRTGESHYDILVEDLSKWGEGMGEHVIQRKLREVEVIAAFAGAQEVKE